MTSKVQNSKFLSLVLRHQPEAIGITLDEHGWASVDELLAKTKERGLTRDILEQVVAENDKKRFSFSDDGQRIRANQGHSVSVDLELKAVEPFAFLYHGTATRFLDSIFTHGLRPGSRQHVHLSDNIETARKVGIRHGKPAILIVNAEAMSAAGHHFYLSANNVWLTSHVPVAFLSKVNE